MQTSIYKCVFHFGIITESIQIRFGLLFLVISSMPQLCFPHADLKLQIDAVTAKIKANPGHFILYQKRGELYRRHADYEAALRDFTEHSKFDPNNRITQFLIGRTLSESGQSEMAVAHLGEFLVHQPRHAAALLIFARSLNDLGRIDEASDYFRRSLENTPVKFPDQYIEWSHIFLQPDNQRLPDAIRILELGIRNLGPVVSLVDHAVLLQIDTGNFAGAIRLIKMLPPVLQSTPKWLVTRADCMRALGDHEQSGNLYLQARQQIMALPDARQAVPAMRELSIYIDKKLS